MYNNTYDELYHFGILGMHWGIRKKKEPSYDVPTNTPREVYNIKEHGKIVVKKDQTVQRVTKLKNEKEEGSAYISFKKLDNLKYEIAAGTDGLYWTANWDDPNPNNGYKVKLKVTHDIIAPSYKESVDTFLDTVKDVPVSELVRRAYGDRSDKVTPYDKMEYDRKASGLVDDMSNLSVKEARDRAYVTYSQSLMRSPENKKEFFDNLKKRGYNAVVDHNDSKDGYTETPLIVFERSKNLKQVSSTPITDESQEKTEEMMNRVYPDWWDT